MVKEKLVALCADDFGLSHGVSLGILEAISAGRLTGVSAIVTGPRWPAMGRELARRAPDADIGLHLNLTLGSPLGPMPKFAPKGVFPPISKVIKLAVRGKLPLDELESEIDRQLDQFEAVIDKAPDHVDGHQHVHVLSPIRDILFDALIKRGLEGQVWLRDVSDSMHRILSRRSQISKALSVRALAKGFAKEARQRGFEVNDGFSGFSAFDPAQDYAREFHHYLRSPGSRHLIMCHPGYVDEDLKLLDPVTVTRAQELEFLLSPKLIELLENNGVLLARLSQI